ERLPPEIYLLHVWIRHISPMIWRLLVRSDSTLAALHDAIQIAFGWTDSYLHRFRIHGRDSGVGRVGGLSFSRDARYVRLEVSQGSQRFELSEPPSWSSSCASGGW